jgi:hypothetical protein
MFVFIRDLGSWGRLGNIAENIPPLKKFWGELGLDSEFSAFEFVRSKRRWAGCVSTLWAPAPMKWSDSLTSPARSLFVPAKSVANRVRGMATDGRANAGSRLDASSIFVLSARFLETNRNALASSGSGHIS